MHRGQHLGRERRFDELTPALCDPEITAEQRLRRCRSQANHYFRLQQTDFGLQPGPAGRNFLRIRFGVNTAFAARLPFEMLHDIGYVRVGSVNACLLERLVEQSARRTHEGFAAQIFFISRLLANQDHPGAWAAFTEYRLRSALPQVAGLAAGGGLAELREGGVLRDGRFVHVQYIAPLNRDRFGRFERSHASLDEQHVNAEQKQEPSIECQHERGCEARDQ